MKRSEKGENYYRSGFNCAEAVAKVSSEDGLVALSESTLKAASVFGGGIANQGEICGALLGALIVLSARFGRLDLSHGNELLYAKAAELMRDFEEKNGTIYCIRSKKEMMHSEKKKALEKKLTCAARVKIALEKLEEIVESDNKNK